MTITDRARVETDQHGYVVAAHESETDRQAKLMIREGLRRVLRGIEMLWGLPHSFETKKEQGRR